MPDVLFCTHSLVVAPGVVITQTQGLSHSDIRITLDVQLVLHIPRAPLGNEWNVIRLNILVLVVMLQTPLSLWHELGLTSKVVCSF